MEILQVIYLSANKNAPFLRTQRIKTLLFRTPHSKTIVYINYIVATNTINSKKQTFFTIFVCLLLFLTLCI